MPRVRFPTGDTLGVILSFLPAWDILRFSKFLVSKEWHAVLCNLPHSWAPKMDLVVDVSIRLKRVSRFAWNNVRSLSIRLELLRNTISRFPSLKMLALWECRISDEELNCITTLPLERLGLSGCFMVNDVGLAQFASMPLQHLDLYGCWMISDAGLAHLLSMPLRHLVLRHCQKITDAGLVLLSVLPLQHLDLYDCDKITDDGLEHISSLRLQHLDLSWCKKVTDAGLAHLSSMPLHYLNLLRCDNLTDAGLTHMSSMPLQYLNLRFTKVTGVGLCRFLNLRQSHIASVFYGCS